MRVTSLGALRRTLLFLVLASLVTFATSLCPAQSDQSPREQLQQYVTQLQANPSDDALRTKIIQLALTLDPKPAVPDQAAIDAAKGKTIFASATTPDDMKAAAAAFAQASNEAPWVPDYYYNEGSALEKAKQYDNAIHALKFYLVAAPNASDANEVRGRIEAIKYQKEKATQQSVTDNSNKYVSGGAKRLTGHHNTFHLFNSLYGYFLGDPTSPDCIVENAFQMPNGQIVAVVLEAQSTNDKFSGDQVLIVDVPGDFNQAAKGFVWRRYEFGTIAGDFNAFGANYKVSVSSPGPDAVVTISDDRSSGAVTIPLRDLYTYRKKNQALQDLEGDWLAASGAGLGGAWKLQGDAEYISLLYFERGSPTPTYVVPLRTTGITAIADTGLLALYGGGGLYGQLVQIGSCKSPYDSNYVGKQLGCGSRRK